MSELLVQHPFGLPAVEKRRFLLEQLNLLSALHVERCPAYRRICQAQGARPPFDGLEQFPFLPVRLFKLFDLKSVPDSEIVKTLTSSGTTGQAVSRIALDRETAMLQTRALSTIMQDFVGKKRLPMIIVDSQSVIKDRRLFSARGAGILGMANFGRDHLYLLNDEMQPDLVALERFLAAHPGEPILIFGFTFMVWQYLYRPVREMGRALDLGSAILIHSGGWKKLLDESVDNDTYKKELGAVLGIRRVHNFYGMVEQVGSVFVECEHGYLHAPVFSDILVRDASDWSVVGNGREGVVELLSVLPSSYPGHVLLSEDIAVVHGEDDCRCGRQGKYFLIKGRIPKAEVRGCSDTHAAQEGGE